ncbi:MAG: HAD family hydrolase [Labilithrix sp.]|nr:HAD family hydrolase [Labilithrix sp.]MCW5831712.1 HAD family hydrolase [Labilithrix sp.]
MTAAAPDVAAELVTGVDLLCLDAGNTVIFLDHARLADIVRESTGVVVSADVLVRVEGEAKRLAESGELHDAAWSERERPGAIAWGRMVGTIALRAGVAADAVPALLAHAWREHERRNLWSKVPEGLGAALDAMRALGPKVAIISNSEGMLDRLFRELGVLEHFDLVVDSGQVGFEKPDPRIFGVAFERFGVGPDRALHLGDIFATDVLGARAAGCRHALIDPFGHYAGRHPDVPRVPGAVEVARAIASARPR